MLRGTALLWSIEIILVLATGCDLQKRAEQHVQQRIAQSGVQGVDEIAKQVAAGEVSKYQIVKRSGGALEACVQAGMVAAAFLQAKDEAGYQQWHKIEQADCEAAGMRSPNQVGAK